MDASENFITCVQLITVHDVTGPVITCPTNLVLNCQDNNSSPSTGVATATDNCSPVTISQSQTSTQTATGAGHYNYAITRTWRATDISGNFSTCIQTITVRDITNPVITCVVNQTRLTNTGLCTYQVQGAEFNATATDNCTTPAFTYVLTGATTGSGSTSLSAVNLYRGTTTVTWTATDPSGNFNTCSFNVVVNDDQNATSYIIYATDEAQFGENNYINGDVGVTSASGEAGFKKYDVLNPYTVRAKNISVELPSSVNNRVYSPATGGPNPAFYMYNGNTTGLSDYTVTTNMTLNGNYKNLTIMKEVTVTVTGNNFGKISIEEDANVTFTGPAINIEEITVGKGKKSVNTTNVYFSNPASVKVKNKVTVEEDCRINIGGPKVTFYIGDNNPDREKFTIKGDNTQVTANIMIPHGKLKIIRDDNQPCIMTGWYIIEELESKVRYVYWNKYDCSMPSAPAQSFVNSTNSVTEVVEVVKDKVVQVVEDKDAFSVKAYPNPSSSDFNLAVTGRSNELIIVRIIDMNGSVKEVTQLSGSGIIKAGSKLSSGTYMAEVVQGKKRAVVKLVKLN
jgi:hypothetical protein